MARNVYVTAMEPGSGKSAVVLGLTEVLSRNAARLAFYRPFVAAALGLVVFVVSLAPVFLGMVPMTFIPRLDNGSIAASVVRKASMVAMFGAIIPQPLAMPPSVKLEPRTTTSLVL